MLFKHDVVATKKEDSEKEIVRKELKKCEDEVNKLETEIIELKNSVKNNAILTGDSTERTPRIKCI